MPDPHVIQVQPDKPALLAQRLMARLKRDGLIPQARGPLARSREAQVIEALADEIHQDILGATLRAGS